MSDMLYYYPNKPILIHPTSSLVLEKSNDPDWVSEIKKNGTRLCLRKAKEEALKYKSYEGLTFWNRHKSVLKYEPSIELLEELKKVKIPEGTQIDAELMHFKTKNIKHLIYVYDIYWFKNKTVTETFDVRRKMIEDIFCDQYKHIELAKQYSDDFLNLYTDVTKKEENEGLVIKCKKGKIQWNFKDCIEVWWQLKIRKQSNSYRF